VRRDGWSPKGERRHASAPFGYWRSTTLSFAIDASACRGVRVPGATDAAAFRTFVAKVLLPELRRGDVLVLDNHAAHGDA
jgi:hypothetical protein